MIHPENDAERPTECPPIQERTTTAWYPVLAMLSMLFIEGMGYFMALAPQTRLFEKLVCEQHYSIGTRASGGPPTEEMCKIPEVQNAVAMLFGFQAFFDGLPGLILAMPYGVLADQIGRKRILVLSMLGQVLGGCWILFICM
jgi:MFS family permease